MRVGVERATEPLDERHGPALAANSKRPAAPALPHKQRPEVRPEHFGEQAPIHGERQPELPREREHPLAVVRCWQHAINEMRGGVAHPARPARRADAPLAREG